MSPTRFIFPAVVLGMVLLLWLKRDRLNQIDAETRENLETDARRFAGLLVSEIKLYNDYKVRRGLKNNNLYDYPEIEIEGDGKKYEKGFFSFFGGGGPAAADRQEYFDDALIEILADGDAAKLGPEFAPKRMKLNEPHP